MSPHNWKLFDLGGLAGTLFSPGRGLLIYQPWIVLLAMLAIGRRHMPKSAEPVGWMAFCAVCVLLQIALVSS
jgi:fumarate reductase subunit D